MLCVLPDACLGQVPGTGLTGMAICNLEKQQNLGMSTSVLHRHHATEVLSLATVMTQQQPQHSGQALQPDAAAERRHAGLPPSSGQRHLAESWPHMQHCLFCAVKQPLNIPCSPPGIGASIP